MCAIIHHFEGFISVGISEGWLRPSTPLVFKCCGHLSECTIRLRYVYFLTTIVLRELVAPEVLQVMSKSRSRVRTLGVSLERRLLVDQRVDCIYQLLLCSNVVGT